MAKKTGQLSKLAELLYEAGTLRKTMRSHRQTLLTDDLSDNIASHSYRVAVIGWFLAKLEKADAGKVASMCIFHDFGETRSGDQNWVHKKYTKTFEEEITIDQFTDKPFGAEILELLGEYSLRESKEAKLAKDADLIDQILLLKEHEWSGNKEASLWLKEKEQEKMFFSKSARDLTVEIYKQRPSKWWSNLWTAKRR